MFIASADLHLRDTKPQYRKDDFCTNQFIKLEQLLEYTANTTNLLVLAGDIFHSKGVNYATVIQAMGLIQHFSSVEVLLVAGQHDLRYHRSGLNKTPLGVILQLNNVHLLKPDETFISNSGISFIGCSWNEEPTVKADVLAIHKMVTESGPLWPGQVDYTTGKALLKKYKDYLFIISGDNHRPHKTKYQGRTNINCGSMCRTGKDQYNYKPAFWHVKNSGIVTKVPYKIEKASEVFDNDKIVRDETFQKNRERFQEMTDSISTKTVKPDFERILLSTIKEAGTRQEVINLINSKMEAM